MVTNEELNNRLQVSPSYLKKITRKMVVGGLIQSTYGVKGGYKLARQMSHITLYDLVAAIDGHESFFQTTGLIEQVFPNEKSRVKLGKNLLGHAFNDAQNKLNHELKKKNMAQMIHALKKV